MSLVYRVGKSFKKTAASSLKLPSSQQQWPTQILQEAYRQVPMLQDLAVELRLDRTDEIRGFGVGKIMLKEAGVRVVDPKADTVNIPVTIRDREMDPLDVLMVGKAIFPLTEEKLASQFSNFSVGARNQRNTSRPATGQDNISRYTSPSGGDSGGGNYPATKNTTTAGGYKLASESMLGVAAATARQADKDALQSVLKEIGTVNESLQTAVNNLMSVQTKSASELSELIAQVVEPDHMTITAREDGSYVVKTASARFFKIQERVMDRLGVESLIGPALLKKADTSPVRFTKNMDAVFGSPMELAEWDYRGPGIYKVAANSGDKDAFVFSAFSPRKGGRTGAVAVLGEGGLVQYPGTNLAAKYLAPVKLASEVPGGTGVFVWSEGDEVLALPHCEVIAKVASSEEGYWLVNSEGGDLKVYTSDVVKTASLIDGGVILPSTTAFIGCARGNYSVRSAQDGVRMRKLGAEADRKRVELFSVGDGYQFDGQAVGGLSGEVLSAGDSDVVLRLLGSKSPGSLMKKASREQRVVFSTTGTIKTASDVRSLSVQEAILDHTDFPSDLGFRKEIVKLAASLPPDKETIDTILSLNFLNADNIRVLRGYLPEIEKTASRLAELLIASRMGLNTDPEPTRLAMHYVRRVADQIRSGVSEGV